MSRKSRSESYLALGRIWHDTGTGKEGESRDRLTAILISLGDVHSSEYFWSELIV